MRRYAGALIAVGIFVVLLLVVLLTQGGGGANATPTPTTAATNNNLQILSLPVSQTLSQLEVKSPTATMTLKFEAGKWKRTAPTPLELDAAVVADTIFQLRSLRGETLIPAENANNLATYGLDNPSLTVTLTPEGSAPRTLLFGLLNKATGNYYVKLADDAKVWVVAPFYVTTLLSWLTTPPTPAPTIAPVSNPQTPLPSVTPTATPAPPTPTVVAATAPATTAPATTTVAATTPAASTTVPATATAKP